MAHTDANTRTPLTLTLLSMFTEHRELLSSELSLGHSPAFQSAFREHTEMKALSNQTTSMGENVALEEDCSLLIETVGSND